MQAFIGQIMMFGGNFAPRSWALCDGTLLPISQNAALYSILGTAYGGDGRTTFALPDLRGRVAVHPGNGPGLSSYRLGQRGGAETVTLTQSEMPSHTHLSAVNVTHSLTLKTTAEGEEKDPTGYVPAPAQQDIYGPSAGSTTAMESGAVEGTISATNTNSNTGGNLGHTNIQPFECVNYIICLQGIFPSRN